MPGRGKVELAGIGLRIGDQFGNAVDRRCRIDDDHIGKTNERSDRRSIPDEIEIELGEQRDIGRVRGCGKQQRVAGRVQR